MKRLLSTSSFRYVTTFQRRRFSADPHNVFFDFINKGKQGKAESDAERRIPFPMYNNQIKSKQVVVIDDQKQKQGPMPLKQALKLAEEVGLDLIQTKTGKIPVCKIQSFSQIETQIIEARKKMARTINEKMEKATAGEIVT